MTLNDDNRFIILRPADETERRYVPRRSVLERGKKAGEPKLEPSDLDWPSFDLGDLQCRCTYRLEDPRR